MSIEKFKDFRIFHFETHYFCYLCPFLYGKLFVRREAGLRSSIWKNVGVEVPSIWQNNWGIQTTFYHKTPPSGKKTAPQKTAIKKNFFDETTPNSCHADCDTNKQGEETPSIQELQNTKQAINLIDTHYSESLQNESPRPQTFACTQLFALVRFYSFQNKNKKRKKNWDKMLSYIAKRAVIVW